MVTPSKYEGMPSKYVGVSEKRSPRRQKTAARDDMVKDRSPRPRRMRARRKKTAARPPVFGGRDDMMNDDMLKGKPPLRRKQPWDVKEA